MQLHGSFPYRECEELGLNPEDIIDFSASVNPFPLPQSMQDAYRDANLRAYPDRANVQFIESIASFYQLDTEYIIPAAGTTELIYALPHLFKRPRIIAPAYGDYKDAFRRFDIEIEEVSFADCVIEKELDVDLLIIINPSNPEGHYVTPQEIRTICELNPTCQIVIDEAYQELGEQCESVLSLVHEVENLMVLRSLTKSFAIAGIRAGFGYSKSLATHLKKHMTPWALSTSIQNMLPAMIDERDCFVSQWDAILQEKRTLTTALDDFGLTICKGRGPFILFEVPDGPAFRNKMLREHQIHVRECTSFGLQNWIRIMPGLPHDNQKLLESIPLCL